MFRKIICCISIFILICACCLVPSASAESVEYNYLINFSDIKEIEDYSMYTPTIELYSGSDFTGTYYSKGLTSYYFYSSGLHYYSYDSSDVTGYRVSSAIINFSLQASFKSNQDYYFDFYFCTYGSNFVTSIDFLESLNLSAFSSESSGDFKPISVDSFLYQDEVYYSAHFSFVLKAGFFPIDDHTLYFSFLFNSPSLKASGLRLFLKPGTSFIIRDYTTAEQQSDLTADKVVQGLEDIGSDIEDPELPTSEIDTTLDKFNKVEEVAGVDYPGLIDFLTDSSSFIESMDFYLAGSQVSLWIYNFLNNNLVIKSFILFCLSFSVCIFVLGRGFK